MSALETVTMGPIVPGGRVRIGGQVYIVLSADVLVIETVEMVSQWNRAVPVQAECVCRLWVRALVGSDRFVLEPWGLQLLDEENWGEEGLSGLVALMVGAWRLWCACMERAEDEVSYLGNRHVLPV